jgi:hypothetical protein
MGGSENFSGLDLGRLAASQVLRPFLGTPPIPDHSKFSFSIFHSRSAQFSKNKKMAQVNEVAEFNPSIPPPSIGEEQSTVPLEVQLSNATVSKPPQANNNGWKLFKGKCVLIYRLCSGG